MTKEEREAWLDRVREAYREGFQDAIQSVKDTLRYAVHDADETRKWKYSVSASYAKEQTAAAVDPHVDSTGTPTPRENIS